MNNDVHNENKGEGFKGTTKLPVPSGNSLEHLPTSDIMKIPINKNTEQRKKSEAKGVSSRNIYSGMELGCQPNRDVISEPDNESNFPATSEGADSVKLMNLENSANRKLFDLDAKNLDDSTNDFSSTSMLDEELELERKTIRNDHSTAERYFRFFLLDLHVSTIVIDLSSVM